MVGFWHQDNLWGGLLWTDGQDAQLFFFYYVLGHLVWIADLKQRNKIWLKKEKEKRMKKKGGI